MMGAKQVIKVEHFKRVNGSPASAFVVRGYSKIVDNLPDISQVALDGKNEVIYARHGDDYIGFISFVEYEDYIWVCASYVDSKFRKQGIYSKMYKKLRTMAKKRGYRSIESGIAPKNKAMLKAAKSAGREIHSIVVVDRLKPKRA